MSTYYNFVCRPCNLSGGFLSQQAWGIGNFDIIGTFKFVMLHRTHEVVLQSEHEPIVPQQDAKEFVEATHGIFPRSNDWNLMGMDSSVTDGNAEWERRLLGSDGEGP